MFSWLRALAPWSFPVILIAGYVWSALSATAATQTTVGAIEDLQGRGWGISQWGEKYDKLGGDMVALDEVVATGMNSAMTMRFIDNTTMTLGPSAEITVDQMVYNPDNGEKDGVTLTLGKGTFYFVSGLVAKDKVTIITPTATIGIRGTELVINVERDGSTSVGVAKGHAFMRSKDGDSSVEVEVGNTARADDKGRISDPFPGIDLTGEDEVDRKIPGVVEWLGEEEDDDDKKKDFTEFTSRTPKGEDDDEDGRKGRHYKGEDGGDFTEDDDSPDEDVAGTENRDDQDEVASTEDADGEDGDQAEGEGEGEGEGDDGSDGGDDGSDGGDDGSDGGDDGGEDGGDSDGSQDGGDGHDSED